MLGEQGVADRLVRAGRSVEGAGEAGGVIAERSHRQGGEETHPDDEGPRRARDEAGGDPAPPTVTFAGRLPVRAAPGSVGGPGRLRLGRPEGRPTEDGQQRREQGQPGRQHHRHADSQRDAEVVV